MLSSRNNTMEKTSNITTHPATVDDVPAMAALWHERMTLQQLTDRRLRLLPSGREKWSAAVERWLADDHWQIVVARQQGEVVGYSIGLVQDNLPGVAPECVGVVSELVIGVHSAGSGAGQLLLQPLKAWFAQQGIQHIVVQVSPRQPVEQAFWRALGASEWIGFMWMEL